MTFDGGQIRTILFDYGNTLVPFSHDAVAQLDGAFERALARHFGRVDREQMQRLREADRLAPYRGDHRENDPVEVTASLVCRLYGRRPSPEVLEDLLRVRYEAFIDAIELPAGVLSLLHRLSERYRLGLVSNYPDGAAIRHSLRRIGIESVFEAIVISGEVGYVKPHPCIFNVAAEKLQLDPQSTLLIGDNWLGDVQGAKRYGMKAAWLRQYDLVEVFPPNPGDHPPDLVLDHLNELESHLGMDGNERSG